MRPISLGASVLLIGVVPILLISMPTGRVDDRQWYAGRHCGIHSHGTRCRPSTRWTNWRIKLC
jgi:hypothetical protein